MGKNYKVYRLINTLFTAVTVMFTAFSHKGEGFEYIAIIPAVYLSLFLVCKKIHKYSQQYGGMMMLNVIMFIKYVVTNFFICLNQEFDLPGFYRINVEIVSYHIATLLLTLEMISVFVIIELFSDKLYRKSRTISASNGDLRYVPVRMGPVLWGFLIIGTACILFKWNAFISGIRILFTSENSLTDSFESGTNNILHVIFHAMKIIGFGLLINDAVVKYTRLQKKRYVFLSYVYVSVLTLLSTSTSRLNMIIPFILFVVITGRYFKKTGIILDVILSVVLVIGFSIVSVYKNPWLYAQDVPVLSIIAKFTEGLQGYTSGMVPTAIGLQAVEEYSNEITLLTLFNDIFGSVPLISHVIDAENRIYRLYNLYALGGSNMSQLIPMTVSSMAYFSPLFSFVLVDLFVILLMYVENRSTIVHKNYVDRYLHLYLLFICASCLISNVQMLSGRFFVNYLPTAMVLWVNKKVGRNVRMVLNR